MLTCVSYRKYYKHPLSLYQVHIATLKDVSIPQLTNAFNSAFEGYAVPMRMSEDQLIQKIHAECIDLSLSAGAFDNNEIVGFILIGIDTVDGVKTAWEGGTGVLKGYRGKRLSVQIFEYIFPVLKASGVKRIQIEMLETNEPMYRIHSGLGFNVTRKLHAYKGIPSGKPNPNHRVEILTDPDIESLKMMDDWQPAWQQMNKRVAGWGDKITTIGIKDNDNIVAYAHYDAERNRVFQFAVDNQYRRRGMGTAMFQYMSKGTESLSVINVSQHSQDARAFLDATGLQNFINQYEMSMDI